MADDDRALGSMQDVVADAGRREGAAQTAEAATPEHDQPRPLVVGRVDDDVHRLAALQHDLSRQLQPQDNRRCPLVSQFDYADCTNY